MLKDIPPILSPELLKVLCEMGHGDEIVIADGNFPSASTNSRVIRLDGHGGENVLEAVMNVFPLDTYADSNAVLMDVVVGDTIKTPIWNKYKAILNCFEGENVRILKIERFAFYERVRKAYAVIATSETQLYANIIIKKGVIV